MIEETTAETWSVATGRRLRTFECGSSGHCLSAAFSPDGTRILAAGFDGKAHLWDLTSGRRLHVFTPHVAGGEGLDQAFTDAQFSADGHSIVVEAEEFGTDRGTVSVYDTETGRARFVIGSASDATFSPNATLLAAHQGRQTIQIRDAHRGHLLEALP